jgi:prephenate dehydrogenase
MRLAVLGVGLIGGSIGQAAKRGLGAEVVGWDRDQGTLAQALELGALDRAAESVADAVAGVDAVFCAAPVNALPALVGEALAASGPETVVTDVGSTKRELVEAVRAMPASARFVGGHPLAGAETAGVGSSRPDLFEDARWYLTPTDRSEGVLLDRLHGLVSDFGARPQAIDAAEHDLAMAKISHLPHVIANVLVSRAAAGDDADRRLEVGRSFRDTTRVAGANPAIWADIFAGNGEAIAREIEEIVEELRDAADLIARGDRERIASWQATAAQARRELLEAELAAGPLHELRVAVPNRPGIVAEVALALSRDGVNIEDMSLFPAADGRSGAISLWVGGEQGAERAAETVRGLGHRVSIVPPGG